ncbi:TonB-dependent receptor domain-containing protein [Duganella sp. Dugasp56]|uniref:TonB-dependent receptor n=1 Tax=Duganella sp. Dugasp56 TaxID=3243046 RepID=UPI00159E441A
MGNKLMGLSALAMVSASAIVSGQTQAPAPASAAAPAADRADQIERIEVTASRSARAEEIQQVPMALTAIKPESLAKFGLSGLADIARLAPSVDMQEQGPGVNNITMRGLVVRGITPSEIADASLVAVYVDDMPVTLKSGNPDLKVLDLERIEVLRGPQGTLYGAGAMAGTIRQITQKPDTDSMFGSFEAVGSSTSGNGGNNGNLRGMVNVPVKEGVLGLRVTGYTGEDSGYVKNVLNGKRTNDSHTDQGRVAMRLQASPDLTVDASITASSMDGGLNGAFSGLAPFTTSAMTEQKTKDDMQLYNLAVNYKLARAELVSSTTFVHRKTLYKKSDEYNTTAFIFPGQSLIQADYTIANKLQDFAQEFRLNSTDAGPLKWTGGLFLESGKRDFWEDEPTPGMDARYAAAYGFPGYSSLVNDLAFNKDDQFSGTQESRSRQAALFAEATYTLWDKLDLTAGVRLFTESEDFKLRFTGYYGNTPAATVDAPVGTPNVVSSKASARGGNPRFAAAYHLDPEHLLYAQAGKGFRYGGNNQPVPQTLCGIQAPASFGPDQLWSYELGSKNTFLNQRVSLNVAAFLIDWEKVQVANYLPCSYYYTQNAGKIRSQGLEIESMVKLARRMSLGFNAAYTDAKAKTAIITPLEAQSAPAGTRTPYAPRLTASLSFNYTVPLANSDEVGIAATYSYRGNSYTDFAPTGSNYAEIPSSSMLNAALSYKSGKYEFGLFGTNLNNRTKVVDVTRDPNGLQPGDTIYMARPRTVGVRVKARF